MHICISLRILASKALFLICFCKNVFGSEPQEEWLSIEDLQTKNTLSRFYPFDDFRFGIKGAAYLKNKDGLVISCGPEGSSEWKPGSLQRSQNKITSTTAGGQSVTFHLFDHVTVSLCTFKVAFNVKKRGGGDMM